MAYAGQRADWKFHVQSVPGMASSSNNEFCTSCYANQTIGDGPDVRFTDFRRQGASWMARPRPATLAFSVVSVPDRRGKRDD